MTTSIASSSVAVPTEKTPQASQAQLGYLMALTQIPGLGPRKLLQLLAAVESPEALWHASDTFLKTHLKRTEQEKFRTTRTQWEISPEKLPPEALPETYQRLGIEVIAYTDSRYPQVLKETYDPPVLLYARGDVSLLNHPHLLAVVGNRRVSDYGRRVCAKLISEMADFKNQAQVCIVSGLAEGIDGEAHRQALYYQLPTIAVFGCGIDQIFPKCHEGLALDILEAGGLLVSEYPLGYPPSKATFPQRNRIVSGMSAGVLIAEGTERSGSLITARLALEENRTVFAVPGNIFSPGSLGPLRLLKQGATPVSAGSEIMETLGWVVVEAPAKKTVKLTEEEESETQLSLESVNVSHLSDTEQQVYALIPSGEPIQQDQLAKTYSTGELQTALTTLELEGLIEMLPGAQVRRA